MPRFHLFELEDQSWFPHFLRDLMTDYLRFQTSVFRLYDPIVPKLLDALRVTGQRHLLDLCSGGAGPVLQVQRHLDRLGWPVAVTLSDRFPNQRAFERFSQNASGEVRGIPHSIDAMDVPAELNGFRTLFTAIHHFRPEEVKRIILNARQQQCAIGIFDIAQRSPWMLLYVFWVVPLAVFLCTPFIRPFCWRRFFWTYILPVVPLVCWWDGLVSQLRAYSVEELRDLIHAQDPDDGYHWEVGRLRAPLLPGGITFLIGYPKSSRVTTLTAPNQDGEDHAL